MISQSHTTLTVLACVLYFLSGSPWTADARLFKFTEPGQPNRTCILLDTNFSISIEANDKDSGKKIAEVTFTSDDNVTLTGSCADANSPPDPVLILVFSEAGSEFLFQFSRLDNEEAGLARFMAFNPSVIFDNSKEKFINETVVFIFPVSGQNNTSPIGSIHDSYMCRTHRVIPFPARQPYPGKYRFRVKINLDGIQVQGYNVQNGEFSQPHICKDDITTTPIPATTTITPVDAPVNNYTVSDSNTTCIVLEGAIWMEIEYNVTLETANSSTTEIRVARIEVPSEFNTTGSTCALSNTSQELVIEFYEGWELTFTFSDKYGEQSDDASNKDVVYGISNITLKYTIDEDNFPNATEQTGTEHTSVPESGKPEFPQKSNGGAGYYKCDSSLELPLSEGVKVKTTHLKFKAFNTDDDVGFNGHADECAADKADDSGDDKLYIILGACGGALVVIVIIVIVVVVRRRSNRAKYVQMG